MRVFRIIAAVALACAPLTFAQEANPDVVSRRVALLKVSDGQLPNDTGSGKTQFSTEPHKELGGRALKVVFAEGDAFGLRNAGERDWKRFAAVEFTTFNPEPRPVTIIFTVRHAGSKDFATRVDAEIALKSGKDTVRLPLASLKNHNGSEPDFTAVHHWHLLAEGDQPRTIFFGDFFLTGGVEAKSTDDPARLARIRAAAMPKIARPVMFDTPEADAILAALEVFPPDYGLNQTVTSWPVHPNSRAIVDSIGAKKPLRYNPDMAFILVPPTQPRVPVVLGSMASESDRGPYPVPPAMPIEGWPVHYQRDSKLRALSLADVQRDKPKLGGDRHAIVVDPVNRMLFEFYAARLTDKGWTAEQASIFDLKTHPNRPKDWTSTDAAGLPVFPTVVRYDELARGEIEHAMRVTVERSRHAYIHPATHQASPLTDTNLPRMGERLRVRADFDTSGMTAQVRTIVEGLKKYGAVVADNGLDWSISVAPDPRIPELHEELRKVKGADFEVVVAP